MATRGFSHDAKVVAVDGEIVDVEIVSATACDGCHAKGSCGAAGAAGERRVVRVSGVSGDLARSLSVGDGVELSIKYSIGAYATLVAYILPLVIFVCSIVGAIILGAEEGVAALLGFGVTALYYCGVYLFRSRAERGVNFTIRKL